MSALGLKVRRVETAHAIGLTRRIRRHAFRSGWFHSLYEGQAIWAGLAKVWESEQLRILWDK